MIWQSLLRVLVQILDWVMETVITLGTRVDTKLEELEGSAASADFPVPLQERLDIVAALCAGQEPTEELLRTFMAEAVKEVSLSLGSVKESYTFRLATDPPTTLTLEIGTLPPA